MKNLIPKRSWNKAEYNEEPLYKNKTSTQQNSEPRRQQKDSGFQRRIERSLSRLFFELTLALQTIQLQFSNVFPRHCSQRLSVNSFWPGFLKKKGWWHKGVGRERKNVDHFVAGEERWFGAPSKTYFNLYASAASTAMSFGVQSFVGRFWSNSMRPWKTWRYMCNFEQINMSKSFVNFAITRDTWKKRVFLDLSRLSSLRHVRHRIYQLCHDSVNFWAHFNYIRLSQLFQKPCRLCPRPCQFRHDRQLRHRPCQSCNDAYKVCHSFVNFDVTSSQYFVDFVITLSCHFIKHDITLKETVITMWNLSICCNIFHNFVRFFTTFCHYFAIFVITL